MKDGMAYCNDCQKEVEAITRYEHHHEEPNFNEPFTVCPICGGTDIDPVCDCGNCGKPMADNGEKYCDACHEEAARYLNKCIKESGYPIELINDELEHI